jgi:hypothetical protein
MGGVCALILAGGQHHAHAQPVTEPINVRALILPDSRCPNVTASAVGDGSADDTAELQCAIDKVPASGGEIYMPAGRYKLTFTLSVENKNITFRGDGQRLTNLEWHAGNDFGNGIEFKSLGSVNHTLNVRSLSLLRAAGSGGTAITGTWQATASSPLDYGGTSATFFDVHISKKFPGITWTVGIGLGNAVGARINSFNIDGSNEQANSNSSIQIYGKSIGVSISDGNIGKARWGVHVANESENVRIENVETSQNGVGYFFDTTGKHHSITNCHAGAVGIGIQFNNSSDAVIAGNFLLLVRTGILISNPDLPGARFQVRDNLLVAHHENGEDPHDPHVIEISGAVTDAIVMGNSVKSTNIVGIPGAPPQTLKTIHLDTGVSNSLVTGNYIRTYTVVNNGTNNFVDYNY